MKGNKCNYLNNQSIRLMGQPLNSSRFPKSRKKWLSQVQKCNPYLEIQYANNNKYLMKESLFSLNVLEKNKRQKGKESFSDLFTQLLWYSNTDKQQETYAEPNKLTTSKVLVLEISCMLKYIECEALYQKTIPFWITITIFLPNIAIFCMKKKKKQTPKTGWLRVYSTPALFKEKFIT